MSKIQFIDLDVYADTIAVAVAELASRPLGLIPNRWEAIHKIGGQAGPIEHLKVCYQAGR